ncbi:MAG: ABC transporter ATP-binding protein [Flavobacteriales bacterium]|nr:ABC transporter ATP-binding protein [Flavobacteriales bacterium]
MQKPYFRDIVSAENISVKYGDEYALRDVSFSVDAGETLCIIGSSGSGKTTLLRTLNGLQPLSAGQIEVFGDRIHTISGVQLRRKIGYVLQQPALFPHWSVAKNIGLVPRLLKWKPEQIKNRTRELLDLVNLSPEIYTKRYPSELSGGEQQRVGIARALAANPDLMLYDEPFSALDPITRTGLQQELLSLKEKLRKTTVFVTHDVNEAFLLGDSILILSEGRVVQKGSPDEIKSNPANDYVKTFIEGLHA